MMESLGIEESDDATSLLQESLSLKAFLRVNKEARRDHLISTIEPSRTPIQSPEKLVNSSSITSTARAAASSFQNEHISSTTTEMSSSSKTSTKSAHFETNDTTWKSPHKFSLSYDPAGVMSASTPSRQTPRTPSSPKSPLQSNDYFMDMSHDESKLPMNQSSFIASSEVDYLSERDRSKVAENFNAMNTIINSTFKEKIDYQRKLREQQAELNALKDKMHRLREENAHLVKAIGKNKQSHLPLAMERLQKKRRLAKLRRSLSRWQDSTRGCALGYVQKVERDFQKREAEYVHNGRLVVLKLRSSAFRSLGIITTRRRKEVFRKAFWQWKVSACGSASLQLQKDKLASAGVSSMMNTHIKNRSFRTWRALFTRHRALYSLVRKLGIHDRQRELRNALILWRRGIRRGYHVKVVKACVRTLVRHSPIADCFKTWKHNFCGIYYPQKVTVTKAVWRRCSRMRVQYLRQAFSLWNCHYNHDVERQKRMMMTMNNIRKYSYRKAMRQWKECIELQHKNNSTILKVLQVFSNKSVHMSKSVSFSKWRQFARAVDQDRHALALEEKAQDMQSLIEDHASEISSMRTRHAEDTHSTLQCVRLVVKAMKILSCSQRRQHRLRIAFKRWTYMNTMGKAVHNATCVSTAHRCIMIMFGRLKEMRMVAFNMWKHKVNLLNFQRRIIIRMSNANHKNNVSTAFRKWKEVIWSLNMASVVTTLKKNKVKEYLIRWQHHRVSIPFQKWKTETNFLSSRLIVVSRVSKLLKMHFLKMKFRKWYQATVVHGLMEQRAFLEKWQAAKLKTIEQCIASTFDKCQSRVFLRWKRFTEHSLGIKKAIVVCTRTTHQKLYNFSFVEWSIIFRRRQKLRAGLRILDTLSSGTDIVRIVKYFNKWTRVVANQANQERNSELTDLGRKHNDCLESLHLSQSQYSAATCTISDLTFSNNAFELALAKDAEYKNGFMLHLSNKKLLQKVFCTWKDRYVRFKTKSKVMVHAVRHLCARLDSYNLRQKFIAWKLKMSRAALVTKVFGIFNHKLLRFQIQSAFRCWQHYSIERHVAKVSETVRMKYLQMDNEVLYHRSETDKLNIYIKYWNKWKDYMNDCFQNKNKMRQYIAYIANSKTLVAFQKWKLVNKWGRMVASTVKKWLRVKTYAAFMSWKRKNIQSRKLEGAMRHLLKWQRYSLIDMCRRWRTYLRRLKLQRIVLKSVLLTSNKRMVTRAGQAFGLWKKQAKGAQLLDHKGSFLAGRVRDRRCKTCFTHWQNLCVKRQMYRQHREKMVYGVSQSLPVVRDLYDVLFSADSVEESIGMSTLALEKILPEYEAEIYVMVSNTMLRASVPLQKSASGTSSRFTSKLFDRDTRPSPMDIPSSPIYDQTRSDLSSPQGHVLPASQTPWSTDKSTARGQGEHLFHTPFEQRHQSNEKGDNAEIVSVIVGRGNVGACAKSGSYQVNRRVTSSTSFPDRQRRNSFDDHGGEGVNNDDIVSIVVPLISSGCIVGVVQFTPHRVKSNVPKGLDTSRPNSPVSVPYPSTAAAAMSFSYPFPNPAPHQASFGSYSIPNDSVTLSRSPYNAHSSRFLKTSVAPLPPPQFTELVNMCMDVHISDVSTVSQLCIVVGTLSDSLRLFIDGNIKKTDYIATAAADKEQMEKYIAQLHGEVSAFEESVDKSTKRIEHLEKSRLKYFNESKAFKEKAEAYEKDNEGLTKELGKCKDKLNKYLDKKRSEGVVMNKLHRSLSQATIEVFGTPAATGDHNESSNIDMGGTGTSGGMNVRDLDGRSNSLQRMGSTLGDTQLLSSSQNWNESGRRSLEDSRFVNSSSGNMHINTGSLTPLSRIGAHPPPTVNTMNTATTHDSNYSPALNKRQSFESIQTFK